jgi:hypothetical protein
MKQFVKRIVKRGLRGLANGALDYDRLARHINGRMDYGKLAREINRIMAPNLERLSREVRQVREDKKIDQITAIDKEVQTLLALKYKELLAARAALHPFADVEFRCFSQNGEDGILLYLFSLLGTTNRKSVEMCAGNGVECNTANLIINHGWTGLLVDGNPDNVAHGQKFYAESRDTFIKPPRFVHAWITAANVNNLIRENGFGGDLDLFSLDIDGNDYWIWKALDCVNPRVMVLEYHAAWGADRAVSVPYREDFQLDLTTHPYYCGASLAAFVKLGRQKGYRLIGCQRYGFNAFFLREGVGEDLFPEVDAADCLGPDAHGNWDWGGREWVDV